MRKIILEGQEFSFEIMYEQINFALKMFQALPFWQTLCLAQKLLNKIILILEHLQTSKDK